MDDIVSHFTLINLYCIKFLQSKEDIFQNYFSVKISKNEINLS